MHPALKMLFRVFYKECVLSAWMQLRVVVFVDRYRIMVEWDEVGAGN